MKTDLQERWVTFSSQAPSARACTHITQTSIHPGRAGCHVHAKHPTHSPHSNQQSLRQSWLLPYTPTNSQTSTHLCRTGCYPQRLIQPSAASPKPEISPAELAAVHNISFNSHSPSPKTRNFTSRTGCSSKTKPSYTTKNRPERGHINETRILSPQRWSVGHGKEEYSRQKA